MTREGERFRLLLEAKFKTDVDNPALESEVDRSMVEDRNSKEEVVMVVEGSSASQDPDDCGEFHICNGDIGGVVSGEYEDTITIIHEQTQDFETRKLMTLRMNGTTGYFMKRMEPGLLAVDILDEEK